MYKEILIEVSFIINEKDGFFFFFLRENEKDSIINVDSTKWQMQVYRCIITFTLGSILAPKESESQDTKTRRESNA